MAASWNRFNIKLVDLTWDALVDGVGDGIVGGVGTRKSRVSDVGAVLGDDAAGSGDQEKTTNAEPAMTS